MKETRYWREREGERGKQAQDGSFIGARCCGSSSAFQGRDMAWKHNGSNKGSPGSLWQEEVKEPGESQVFMFPF